MVAPARTCDVRDVRKGGHDIRPPLHPVYSSALDGTRRQSGDDALLHDQHADQERHGDDDRRHPNRERQLERLVQRTLR